MRMQFSQFALCEASHSGCECSPHCLLCVRLCTVGAHAALTASLQHLWAACPKPMLAQLRAQVPFVTCDDADYAAANIEPLQGKPVKLTVAQGTVTLVPSPTGKAATSAAVASKAQAAVGKPTGVWF